MKKGNQGDGGGRPLIVFDDTQIAQVEALAAVLSKKQLADYMNVGETTFREIEGRQPEVLDAYKRGKAKAISRMGQSLIMQAEDGNTSAAIFYLKTQAGWREADPDLGNHNITLQIVKPDGAN
tara:strand:- start:34 stop:402 length:369 start_codon:yes stop_codon:yes gene_type:complete